MSSSVAVLKLLGETLRQAGGNRCYYYPGMRGDEMAKAIDPNVVSSLNERNAFEFGYGSSIAGGRTVVIFKGVGLATCLDSVQHAVINGVGAGLVVVLLEDTVAASSPEIIDSRAMLDYAKTLLIEPRSIESALTQLGGSFELSEHLDVPVIFRITHELLVSDISDISMPAVMPAKIPDIKFEDYRKKSIGAWGERVGRYEAKQAAIQAYIDELYAPLIPVEKADIAFGCVESSESIPVEHYPVATGLRRYYAEYSPQVRELGSNYGARSLAAEPISLDSHMVAGQKFSPFAVWEKALSKIDKSNYGLVIADEGRYTSDSTNLVDICLCMGSSISVCAGASLQMGARQLALVGDFAYLFNAYPSIVEAAARGAQMDIVLLDDGKASSTGGQASLMPIRIEDVAAHVSGLATYNYDELPAEIIGREGTGVRLYRIVKDE